MLSLETKPSVSRGVLNYFITILSLQFFNSGILFFFAGRLDWAIGWIYILVNLITQATAGLYLIYRRPDLLTRRAVVKIERRPWERWLMPALAISGPFGIMAVSGVDERFNWSGSVQLGPRILGLLMIFTSGMVIMWAREHNFFYDSSSTNIDESDQRVALSGPYQIVRHPGYLAAIVSSIASPLALNSLWALLPATIAIALIITRTVLEDRALQRNLPGYSSYAASVRWRLIPGLW